MQTDTLSSCLPLEVDAVVPFRPADALTDLVQMLTSNLHPPVTYERRAHARTPLPFLLKFVPLDNQGRKLPEEETVVVGRDVSARGLSFFHPTPMPYRRALVTLDHPIAGRFTMEIDIQRCRFHKLGWYESGSRLVRAVELILPTAAQAG
jgi:hypothetical protein